MSSFVFPQIMFTHLQYLEIFHMISQVLSLLLAKWPIMSKPCTFSFLQGLYGFAGMVMMTVVTCILIISLSFSDLNTRIFFFSLLIFPLHLLQSHIFYLFLQKEDKNQVKAFDLTIIICRRNTLYVSLMLHSRVFPDLAFLILLQFFSVNYLNTNTKLGFFTDSFCFCGKHRNTEISMYTCTYIHLIT